VQLFEDKLAEDELLAAAYFSSLLMLDVITLKTVKFIQYHRGFENKLKPIGPL